MYCLKYNLQFSLALLFLSFFTLINCSNSEVNKPQQISSSPGNDSIPLLQSARDKLPIDIALYNGRLLQLAHNKP